MPTRQVLGGQVRGLRPRCMRGVECLEILYGRLHCKRWSDAELGSRRIQWKLCRTEPAPEIHKKPRCAGAACKSTSPCRFHLRFDVKGVDQGVDLFILDVSGGEPWPTHYVIARFEKRARVDHILSKGRSLTSCAPPIAMAFFRHLQGGPGFHNTTRHAQKVVLSPQKERRSEM